MKTLFFTIYLGICFQALHWNNAFASKANVVDKVCYGLGLKNYVRSVVIEVGATATRLLYYGLITSNDGKSIKIDKEVIKEVKVNLSARVNAIPEPKLCLEPLTLELNDLIPENERSKTILAYVGLSDLYSLQSTGLKNTATDLFTEFSKYLQTSGYKLAPKTGVFLKRFEETFLLWVSLNLLLGRISGKPEQTVVALNLGKTFVDIAYVPTKDVKLTNIQLKLFGQNHNVFSQSYNELGFNEMRHRVFLMESSNVTNSFMTQCMYSDQQIKYDYKGVQYTVNGPTNGKFKKNDLGTSYVPTVNFQACLRLIREFVTKYDKTPSLENKVIYAVSKAPAQTKNVKPVKNKEFILTPNMIEEKAKNICRNFNPHVPFMCMDFIYFSTLLKNMFDARGDSEIHVLEKIRKINVDGNFALAYFNLKANFFKKNH